MRLIRWFFTFVVVFAAALLAMLLFALLLVAFGVIKLAGAARWIGAVRVRAEEAEAQTAPSRRLMRESHSDRDLPEAPPEAALHRLRSWDATRNQAVDRWYYKDGSGQWVFVRAPRTA